jgi:hypothetical protein
MILSRRWAFRTGLSMAAVALGVLMLGAWGLRTSRAEVEADPNHDLVRHVTVFAILATPEGKSADSRLTNIQKPLSRLLPRHGFQLLDAQTARIVAGEAIECKLTHGYTVETTLVRPKDEDGKVKLRCELSLDGERQFSATVRTPLNQLFFCERPYLTDGSKLLVGMVAREL